jgi:uncharacterized protein YjbI with pentapeptide repeats
MPLTVDKPHCQLLREERFDEFNRMARAEAPDLRDANLRGCDLRRANLARADLRGAYLRQADLRGVDLGGTQLEGASIHQARLGGTLFPPTLAADEIRLSHELGTRLRPAAPVGD